MTAPLYQLKAEFFKTLGHPARIRVLELLREREHAVAEMLPQVGIEPAHLSQQLDFLAGPDGGLSDGGSGIGTGFLCLDDSGAPVAES